MTRYDRIIKNGMIVDKSHYPRFRDDIGIRGNVIAEIGHIDPADATEILEADDLIVAPNFIDLHTHYNTQLFWDPYYTLSSWHNITSIMISNCGFGFAPVQPEQRERAILTITHIETIPLTSMKTGMPWNWMSFPEFLDNVEHAPKAINILPYVPVAPLLI